MKKQNQFGVSFYGISFGVFIFPLRLQRSLEAQQTMQVEAAEKYTINFGYAAAQEPNDAQHM